MKVLLLLGGEPPSRRLFLEQAKFADFMIAADSGADLPAGLGIQLDVVIGDMDSIKTTECPAKRVLRDSDQNSTDLQKALNFLQAEHAPESIVILGGGGGRSDHLVSNLQICASYPASTKISFINEINSHHTTTLEIMHRLTPGSNIDLEVGKGRTLSLFGVSPFSGLTSQGLQWEIHDADLSVGLLSQSNQSRVDKLKLTLGSGCVYIAIYQ